MDTLNEEQLLDELARMQKSFDKKLNAYKDKVRAGLTEFAEEVEASKARGQTSWTTDSFSSLRPVAEVADEDQDEEPDDDQEEDYEDGDPDDVEGADSDEEVEGQDDEPEQDDELELVASIDESDQSEAVDTLGATAAPSAKARPTKQITTDEKQAVVKAPGARRAAEVKKLESASDVRLVIMAQKEGLGKMVKLDAESREGLVSALLKVKLRKLEPRIVLHVVEQILDKIVKSSNENLKAFRSMHVPQNVVRLKFDVKDIAKASTDEQFGKYYAEIAKVLGSKSPQFFLNEAEVALGLLFEQYKKITKGEEEHQHARFYAITVGKLPEGMEKLADSYFKRRVLGDVVFAALHDTFHAFRHAKRGLGLWHDNYTKIFKALTSAGAENDALRMKLLTPGGRAPNGADLRRLQKFEAEHKIDKKCQGK